jgi:hypothetical protein
MLIVEFTMASHADHFHGAFLIALIWNLLNGQQDWRGRALDRMIRSSESCVHPYEQKQTPRIMSYGR